MSDGEKPHAGDYKVGYGKPPVHSQFQKGVSGYPKGRTSNSKDDFGEVVRRQGSRMVDIQENGQRVKLSAKEVLFMQTLRAALNGDPRARKDAIALLDRYDVKPPTPYEESAEVMAEKRMLSAKIVNLLEEEAARKKEGSDSYKERVERARVEREAALAAENTAGSPSSDKPEDLGTD